MSALTVLIIRHAEKPDVAKPALGIGLTSEGVEDKHSLVIRGWQRVGAWTALFGAEMDRDDYPTPNIVYAANPDQPSSQDGSHSRRPFETITPLCERVHVTPNTSHGVGDEAALVAEVQQLAGVVLICWEHKRIVENILPAFTKGQMLPHLPSKWNGDRFDVVLRLDHPQPGVPWSFRQLFPRLLPGDLDISVCRNE